MTDLNKEEVQEVEVNANDVLKSLLGTEQKVEKLVPMKRFKDASGKPVNFKIQSLDGDVIDRIQDQCTYYTGKGNKRTKKVDEQKFGALIIQRGCLIPNWADPQLLSAYNTHDATDVIKKRLLAGEIAKLSAEIMEISGFDEDEEAAIEEVKN